MKKVLTIIIALFISVATFAQEQKLISDCTISFAVKTSQASGQDNLGSKTIYVKGKDIRIDLAGKAFTQTIFQNNNTGNVTVLKDVGDSKYISRYNADEWKNENAVYNGITISFTNNKKRILDYECMEAILKLGNGMNYTVYYTPTLRLSSIENSFEFEVVPGLILEYESAGKDNKVIYTAEKIDFNPVPSMQFKIPEKGYRVLR